MSEEIRVPNRFESLNELFAGNVRPLIIPVAEDLKRFTNYRDRARTQNGGLLVFLLGKTGIGKTTAVHSVAINLADKFRPVFVIPAEVQLRDAVAFVEQNLVAPSDARASLVLFDGREVSDDQVGIKQLLASLNQLLRRRKDIVFCWPTTDPAWHSELKELAKTIGGNNFSPSECDCIVQGPPKSDWPKLLDRLLLQFGKVLADLGLDQSLIDSACERFETPGEFLSEIGNIIASRITNTRELKKIPRLLFIVSSDGDVSGEANRIRRAVNQILAAEPMMLGYSPKSEAGKWWKERSKVPEHSLGYVISLFEASLVTLSASAITYACGQFGSPVLKAVVEAAGARPDKGNAMRTIQASEFYRYLNKESVLEYTTGRKGRVSAGVLKAYAGIQSLSATSHKELNQAVCKLTESNLLGMNVPDENYEVGFDGDLITDALILMNGEAFHAEFHHLSEKHCKAATISAYIMQKLRTYAIAYQIIPR
jgi:hypothetical protein